MTNDKDLKVCFLVMHVTCNQIECLAMNEYMYLFQSNLHNVKDEKKALDDDFLSKGLSETLLSLLRELMRVFLLSRA